MIRADEVHGIGFTGRGVRWPCSTPASTPATRISADAIVDQQCFCAGCCPNGTSRQSGAGSANDDNGHGTNVAGIIASAGRVAPVGVAPEAGHRGHPGPRAERRLASPPSSPPSSTSSRGPHIKVVNMSLGGGGPFTTVCDTADAGNAGLRRGHRPPARAGHAHRGGLRQRRLHHRGEQPRLHQRRARGGRGLRPERGRHRLADLPRPHHRVRPGHLLLQQQPAGGAAGPGRAHHVVGARRGHLDRGRHVAGHAPRRGRGGRPPAGRPSLTPGEIIGVLRADRGAGLRSQERPVRARINLRAALERR